MNNLRNSLLVRNAVQERNGFNGYGSSQMNDYGGFKTNIYTQHYMEFFKGVSGAGRYDNYYGDYNRIIQTAPTFEFYYTKNNEVQETGAIAEYLKTPNEDYPQFKVLQQIYSEMLTQGYSDVFLWRKNGKTETRLFEKGKKYKEEDFRGITLVSGVSRLTNADRNNIIRIHNGVSQYNVFMGYSPTQAADSWRKMQDEMGLHMTAFAKNAGMPLGQWIITAKSPEDFVKLRDKLEKKTAGARNNGKQFYSYRPTDSKEPQIHWVQFSSQDVQDYTSQLEFSDKKMSQSFGVPGTVKGTNDGENYATARVSEHVFIKYTNKPLIIDFKSQITHAIEQRFELSGEIKVDIPLPEIADESLVKIRTAQEQTRLFERKVAEGYTPESVIKAYSLPESFLLLEKAEDTIETEEEPQSAPKTGVAHNHVEHDELFRQYQNALTKEQRDTIESLFQEATEGYRDAILENGVSEKVRTEYEGKMAVIFKSQYQDLYGVAVEDVVDALTDILDSVDIAELNLSDEELEYAVEQYTKRVADFSKTFAADVAALPGETLEVKKKNADPNVRRVVVSETEHTRVVSELQAWTKAQEEFPVRVYKTWNTREGACLECIALSDEKIDVTALFVGRNDPGFNEIYEVQGGGLHPNCRCFCQYEMEQE